MITARRTAIVPLKNLGAALAYGRETAEYNKNKFGVKTVLQMPVGGNPWRICFAMQFDSLAAMEQMTQKMMSDPKYMELAAKASDIFVVGSAVDEIWTDV